LLNILIQRLSKQTKSSNIIYFDLEDFELIDLCNAGVKPVIEHLKAIGCDFRKQIYLLIDEIQYLENPSSFLKLFLITGKARSN
jgi:predicted AAA+ superfamily ATPase